MVLYSGRKSGRLEIGPTYCFTTRNHARGQRIERHGAQLVNAQSQCASAGADRGVMQAPAAIEEDIANGQPIQVRETGEFFLVPAALLDKAGDLRAKLVA